MYQYLKSFVVISVLMLTMGCIDKKASRLKDGDVVMANTSNTIEVTLFDDGKDVSNELMIKQVGATDNLNYIQSVTRLSSPNKYYLGRYIIQTNNMAPARYQVSRNPFTIYLGAYPLLITSPTILFQAEQEGLEIQHNGKTYFTVISHNKVWLDRNLGATSASCNTDFSSCQGDFYDWQPAFTSTQGHLCPVGFRVPTIVELERLFSTITNRNDALIHNLSIPTVGYTLHEDFLRDDDTVYPTISNDGSGTDTALLSSANEATFNELAFNDGSPSCNGQNYSLMSAMSLPAGDPTMFLPPGGYTLIPTPSMGPAPDLTCPTTPNPSPIDSAPHLSMSKHALLWSSTRNNHGHAYIYFSEKRFGSEYNSGHARFQVRCVGH